jgi:hypothetical protein
MKYAAVSPLDNAVVKVYDVMSPSDIPPLPGPPFLVGPDDDLEVGWIYNPDTGHCLPPGQTAPTPPPSVVDTPHIGAPALAVGEVASCTMGNWTNEPTSYGYLWARDGVPIEGATGETYTFTPADVGASMTCQLTATNDAGSSAPAMSNAIGPIEEAGKKAHKAAEPAKAPEPAKPHEPAKAPEPARTAKR